MVERLCALSDLPKPRIAVIDTDVPNAFATGRSPKHSAVAVTRGLWERLEQKEIEACSRTSSRTSQTATCDHDRRELLRDGGGDARPDGHLLEHVRGGNNRDNSQVPVWLIVMLVAIVTYAISFILIQAISRYREYAADRGLRS